MATAGVSNPIRWCPTDNNANQFAQDYNAVLPTGGCGDAGRRVDVVTPVDGGVRGAGAAVR